MNNPSIQKTEYPAEYLKFIQEHKGKIPPMTSTEQELMMFLVRKKIGGFEKIVKLYRDLTK